MGMFDTIYVDRCLVDETLASDIADALLTHENGQYYVFQTKDMDCMLDSFYIDRDMTFKRAVWDKNNDVEFFQETGEKKPYSFTGYVEFYDHVVVDSRSGFITMAAHILRGKIDSLEIKSVDLREKAELQEEARKVRERWEGIKRTPEWFLLDCIMLAESWFNRHLSRPIRNMFKKITSKLQKRAEKRYDQGAA